jgi:hypothetical protein
MERELRLLNQAQELLRIAENNIAHGMEDIDLRRLTLIRKDLNEFVRDFQYSEEFQKKSEE